MGYPRPIPQCISFCADKTSPQPSETTQQFSWWSGIAGFVKLFGWGGRIRTFDTRYQKALPYHLATPHRWAFLLPFEMEFNTQFEISALNVKTANVVENIGGKSPINV